MCTCVYVVDKCIFKQLIFKYEITTSVLNSGIFNILDPLLLGMLAQKNIFSLVLARLPQPEYSQKPEQVHVENCIIVIHSLMSVHFLRSGKKRVEGTIHNGKM